jgi:hypothetical protein
LHGRWLKLVNDAGQVEVLNRTALTIGSGDHPLFTGVERVVVTGLDFLPSIRRDSLTVTLEAPGLTGRFKGVVDTVGREVRIRLR